MCIRDRYSRHESTFRIIGNSAGERGGGIHAVSSSTKCIVAGSKYINAYGDLVAVYTGTVLSIMGNSASKGGGLYLEANSKITLFKEYVFELPKVQSAVNFIGNAADYGGAVYVDDASNSGSCASNPFNINSPKSECFFQVVATHTSLTVNTNLSLNNVFFDQNHAVLSGSTCLLYTSPSPRDATLSRMPSSA